MGAPSKEGAAALRAEVEQAVLAAAEKLGANPASTRLGSFDGSAGAAAQTPHCFAGVGKSSRVARLASM
jgi:hypothetical protein